MMGHRFNLALAIPLALAFGGVATAATLPGKPPSRSNFDIVTGAGPGAPGGHVKTFDGPGNELSQSFFAYPGFTGGIYVAAGDINGDGAADIVTGAGAGATGGHVKVFDGINGAALNSFFAYSGFSGGVRVAAGDVNGDGRDDIITGAGPGASNGHVKVFDGSNDAELSSFFAYSGFGGGVFVGAGDVNGDGLDDIITGAGAGATGGHVKVFDGRNGADLSSFFAFTGFAGGVTVAGGDIDGDGFADIIVGAGAGAPGGHVKVFSGQTGLVLHDFLAFDPSYTGGVSVGAGLYDGRPGVFVGTLADAALVNVFQTIDGRSARSSSSLEAQGPLSLVASFLPYGGYTGGVYVGGSFAGAVPEPTVWMQLITGFGLAGFAMRSRRRAMA